MTGKPLDQMTLAELRAERAKWQAMIDRAPASIAMTRMCAAAAVEFRDDCDRMIAIAEKLAAMHG